MPKSLPENVLEEQLAYYRARAAEYDEWFLRQGRYNRGPDLTRQWFAEVQEVESSTAIDHHLEGPEAVTARRCLNDGREFCIVKVFYRPDELTVRLSNRGWRVRVQTTAHYFLYGIVEGKD